MKRYLLPILFLFSTILLRAQPANDNCASATTLTIGAALSCGQTTLSSTLQGSECFTNYAGATEQTTWYRFTSSNDSLVLNIIKTNLTNCVSPHVRVWGPFATGAGCLPGCGTEIYNSLVSGDPGAHILLTGLATSGNRDYLVQVQDVDCGGPNDGHMVYCINVVNPAVNYTSSSANLVDACGTAFAGTSNGGYWNNGTSAGFNNLDGNGATTCGGCAAGDDVPFVINNISWTTFCSLTAGTWSITVNGIAGCTLSPPNQGIQASVFTGTPTALVNQGNSPSPIVPGGSWTSPTITVNSGECAYLMIDGFAGDACNYSVTLTNVTGGCIILPIELLVFDAVYLDGTVRLNWTTATEQNNSYFNLEKTLDGINFSSFATIPGVIGGNSTSSLNYTSYDRNPESGLVYYRLKQTDINGEYKYSNIVAINIEEAQFDEQLYVHPNPTSSIAQLTYQCSSEEKTILNVYDFSGSLIYSKDMFCSKGENSFEVNLINQADGIYFITLVSDKKLQKTKLVKKKDYISK